ncbi:hypothetical protein GCM10022244_16510 [Streptomyces gulbargensis]|uniref:YdhG-like domain-containing protein n=2 Tax=Streptomyces gulbargensis TaxID=364901 RepID=A0ABP7LW27_9ACTN
MCHPGWARARTEAHLAALRAREARDVPAPRTESYEREPAMAGTASTAKTTARKTTARTAGKKTAGKPASYDGFTEEEREAMKERAKELKASSRRTSRTSRADKAAEAEADVLAKIAEMPDADRVLAERVHALVKENAPELAPKLWYGMPAYARDGKVVCFFQSAQKFKTRYATLGFSDLARLDDGAMWPAAYALTRLTPADEARIAELVRKAVA